MIKNFFQKNKKKGFTLVETLVAITILMISIAGPMVLVGNGINVSRFSRDQVIAFYLAQDAIESIRFIRDKNRIEYVNNSSITWNYLDSLDQCKTPKFCNIDTVGVYEDVGNFSSHIKSINTDSPDFLIKDLDNGYFRPNWPEVIIVHPEQTKFIRSVSINPNVDANGDDISVTVTWNSGGYLGSRTFTVKESLLNWY